jgi:hypothetical protein
MVKILVPDATALRLRPGAAWIILLALLPDLALAAYDQSASSLTSGGGASMSTTYANTGFVATSATGTMTSTSSGTGAITSNSGGFLGEVNALFVPVVQWSSPSLTFVEQHIGSTSAAQSVTLSNTGNTALTGIVISPTLSEFGLVNGCGSSLLAGASCSLNVSFSPTSVGTRLGALNLTSNATSNPGVLLSGYGVASNVPICTLAAAPASIRRGRSSTLTASCSPAATNYAWTGGSCAGTSASTCNVAPVASTSYSVTGSNLSGTSNPASATLTLKAVDLTPILMLLLD